MKSLARNAAELMALSATLQERRIGLELLTGALTGIYDMLIFTRALRDEVTPMPEITKKLTIKTGKNTGRHPSVASLYRALTEAAETSAPT